MTATSADRRETSSGVQLAEVVAAIALGADLGLGLPLEHVLRSCVIATRFAERLSASGEDRDATYWVTLFLAAGCTGVSFELSQVFGDDLAFRAGALSVGPSTLSQARFLLAHAGSNRGVLGRASVIAGLLRTRLSVVEQSSLAHCAVSALLAERLGLGDVVATSLLQTFARWDGKGLPRRLGGDEILLPIRIANLASLVETRHREHGAAAAIACAREFSGSIFDPALVEAWCSGAAELLAGVDTDAVWETVVAGQPAGRGPLSETELDAALELLADYADLKSPWFTGHSRGVASLAVAAARLAGLPDADLTVLRRAALVHDLGRNGVPNTIWDKMGSLTTGETERVRLHAYYTDRVLHRASRLALLGSVASAAHERAGGTGYPRGIAGGTIPLLGRFLEAADAYHAMLEDRPHRPALTREAAGAELRRAARAGEFDGAAVDAVLAAAGHPARRKPTAPAGLTPREVEVLVLAARGGTTRAVATTLGIAPKTAGNHIERIYSKIGVSSRAEAAMFAMQHGLLPSWETPQP
ncbi:MAG TPA: HD domain-containing phosphohydrolase [Dehalococcoidia bacterium]|nr:HD domain-containing phosphohydrolase [Dehalococcoidia bacterium]